MGLLVLGGTAAMGAAAAQTGPGFVSPPAWIAFADTTGAPLSGPVFQIAGAYPGMAPQGALLIVRNTGEVPATYRVVLHVEGPDHRSLGGAIVVRVRDRSTDRFAYRGALSGLRFDGAQALRPGESVRYTITVSWPAMGYDERFEGGALAFSLEARAVSAGA